MLEASEARNIVSMSSSTNTPTGSDPKSRATFEISFATESETDRLDLGQRIMPIRLAPASAAISASLADVIPHILTIGWIILRPSLADDENSVASDTELVLSILRHDLLNDANFNRPGQEDEAKHGDSGG